MSSIVSIVAAVVVLMGSLPIFAQPVLSLADGRTGRIEFASVTPVGPSDLVRGTGTTATVVGTLVLPPSAEAAMPAMVIAHGSGGILPGREDAWALA